MFHRDSSWAIVVMLATCISCWACVAGARANFFIGPPNTEANKANTTTSRVKRNRSWSWGWLLASSSCFKSQMNDVFVRKSFKIREEIAFGAWAWATREQSACCCLPAGATYNAQISTILNHAHSNLNDCRATTNDNSFNALLAAGPFDLFLSHCYERTWFPISRSPVALKHH